MKNIRILVILPMYGGSLPIGRYCVTALRDLGCSVRVFDSSELYAGFQGFRKLDISPERAQALENSFLRVVSQAIWSMAQEQQPQIVLALAQAPLDKTVLAKMRQSKMHTVMWFVEDYKLFTYWRVFAPLYDAFAVIQKEPFLSELAAIGQNHALYLPLAALPSFHKPLKLTAREMKEYGSDIAFLGAGYPNRRIAFRPLANKDFKIWGSDWDGETVLANNIQCHGRRINEEESVKIYNATQINLNLHSNVDPEKLIGNGDFVNPRTFELAAMGAFQLVDYRSLMGELFKDGELATFTDVEGMYDAIDYYLKHPEEREKYISAAKDRVLKDHTYEKRMIALIDYMQTNFGPFEENAPADIPPELAQKIKSLTDTLGLAPTADFNDVVARLRQRSGCLTELETAILFLDEWRKQYS